MWKNGRKNGRMEEKMEEWKKKWKNGRKIPKNNLLIYHFKKDNKYLNKGYY